MIKLPVAILGATGCVGQKLVELLIDHPIFSISSLMASSSSVGKNYGDFFHRRSLTELPEKIKRMTLRECLPNQPAKIIFSALDGSVAGEIESAFVEKGYIVISNAKNFRLHPKVPLIIPEVNASHLALLEKQETSGKIITNPNCVVAGLALALYPLIKNFGLESVNAVTFQSLSGAGFTGVAAYDALGNVIPHIAGEEEKVETEPLKILGSLSEGKIENANLMINAQCNRVPTKEGHLINLSFSLRKKAPLQEVLKSWTSFKQPHPLLPTAPKTVFRYLEDADFPQPLLHSHMDRGMSVILGNLRPSKLFDYKVTLLVNNVMRGAAGAALLNAELFIASSGVKNFLNELSVEKKILKR